MLIAAVVIGRNEGENLRRCLQSLLADSLPVVYVDSGSTDGSMKLARQLGATVVELDRALPFTAARARNAGAAVAVEWSPEFIQFIDADCELQADWIQVAAQALSQDPSLAVVCGRRRERWPERSQWNRLCDREWDTPIGLSNACGGDALIRVSAWKAAGGFCAQLIAGEEPELCFRLRQLGWLIRRLDCEMTSHDANMHHVWQWWIRMTRGGFAFAEVAWLHRENPERLWWRESLSIWCWSSVLPAALLVLLLGVPVGAMVLLSLYLLLLLRIVLAEYKHSKSLAFAALYALHCVAGKFPQVVGQIRFLGMLLFGRRAKIMEYKLG